MRKQTKPVPLNKMTKKQLLSGLRKVNRLTRNTLVVMKSNCDARIAVLEKERDDFRQSLNGALEEVARLKGEVARLEKAALL